MRLSLTILMFSSFSSPLLSAFGLAGEINPSILNCYHLSSLVFLTAYYFHPIRLSLKQFRILQHNCHILLLIEQILGGERNHPKIKVSPPKNYWRHFLNYRRHFSNPQEALSASCASSVRHCSITWRTFRILTPQNQSSSRLENSKQL
mgnify:CR=1 FL=1